MGSTYAQGAKVTYLGHPATVMHGNEPAPDWTGSDQPGATVNIRFDREVRGHSRQFDIEATAVLPAPASPYVADPANPTGDEIAAAIQRSLAAGTLIDAGEWMARNAEYADYI